MLNTEHISRPTLTGGVEVRRWRRMRRGGGLRRSGGGGQRGGVTDQGEGRNAGREGAQHQDKTQGHHLRIEGNITLVLIIITRALRLWCSWCIGLMQTLQTYWILNFSAYSKLRKEKRTKKHFFKFLSRQKEKGGKMDPFNRDWWKRGDACDILAPSSIWVCLIWVIWPVQLCLAYI